MCKQTASFQLMHLYQCLDEEVIKHMQLEHFLQYPDSQLRLPHCTAFVANHTSTLRRWHSVPTVGFGFTRNVRKFLQEYIKRANLFIGSVTYAGELYCVYITFCTHKTEMSVSNIIMYSQRT